MNARVRGLIIFAVIVAVAVVACGLLPFVWLPAAGVGMALPVITVPGEVVSYGALPGGVNLTNTFIGMIVADILLVIFVLLAWRSSKGWTKEVPGRFQAFVEMLVETIYNFLKNLGGERLRTAPLLWPFVATIFLFLLAANMSKLFPGVESVGKIHCAYADTSGYPVVQGATDNAYILYVDRALDAGNPQTAETEEICNTWFYAYKGKYEYAQRYEVGDRSFEQVRDDLTAAAATAEGEELAFTQLRLEAVEQLIALEPVLEAQQAALAAATAAAAEDHGTTDDHSAAEEDHSEDTAATTEGEETTTEGEEAAATEGEEAPVEETPAPVVVADVAALEAEIAATQQAYNLALSGLQYPGATMPLTAEQLDAGAFPFIFHVTPFVRGAASDLSLTVAYAIMAVIAVQIYGVMALGPAYFEKFINLSALGNLSKRPLGAVDFIVGIFEIISEFAKIISLAFRLFGNIFAGGVALIAISFLVSILVPGVILLLEVVIGAVQALVFSVLTLVFVVQAMEHHGSGDDHGHDGHGETAHH